MQILSLALLSPGAEESWSIYEALHPELRPAIPDDVFSSLIARQLTADKETKRKRLVELVGLARTCGMSPSQLGLASIKDILKSMFSIPPDDRAWPEAYDTLDWLWSALFELINEDFRRIPMKMRQDWLDVTSHRHRGDLARTHAALEHMVEHGGGQGITKAAGRILLRSKNEDSDTIAVSLRLAAWCLARGVNVEELTLGRILARLKARVDAEGQDGRARARELAEGLIAELREGDAHLAAVPITLALEHFNKTHRTPLDRAAEVLEDPSPTIQSLYNITAKVLRNEPGDREREMAVRLCTRALRLDTDLEPILMLVLSSLGPRTDLALQLGQACFHAKVFEHGMSIKVTAKLLNSALGGSKALSAPAFEFATRVYPLIRSSSEANRYQWRHVSLWDRFFSASIKNGRLHLASRLYADLLADGLQVPVKAQLAIITAIASKPSDSRTVLLDRHIKDYLWNEKQPIDDLMVAIAQGMGSTGDSEDAARAVRLCRRLVPVPGRHAHLPARAVEPLMTPLFTSSKDELRSLGVNVLQHLPAETATKAYTLALSALVKNVRSAGLAQVINLYHQMERNGVQATAAIGSLLIMALLKYDHLDSALAIFKTATQQMGAIKSAAMGRLMIALALAGRCDEAYEAEKAWRAKFPKGADYDKAVYGARMVVDFMAGKDVDTSVFASSEHGRVILKEHAGYKPNRFFYNFVESLRPKGAEEAVQEAEAVDGEEVKSEPVVESVAAEESSEPSAARSKRPVQPLTRSWAGSGGSGGWMLDRERERRGVDMCGVGVRVSME